VRQLTTTLTTTKKNTENTQNLKKLNLTEKINPS